MTRPILITGATGNVGRAVCDALVSLPGCGTELEVVAGLRDVSASAGALDRSRIGAVHFDFDDPATFGDALRPGQSVFLLRPPRLASSKPFATFLEQARRVGVGFVVFLSVQGVERSSIIPHHRIEELIVKSGLPYCFLRPAYFMQNLVTTLADDLVRGELVIVAGNARFNWISAADIGQVAARVLAAPASHRNIAYELTGPDNRSFAEVTARINLILGTHLRYTSPSLLRFFLRKRREGVSAGYIAVLMALHYLPRFQSEPRLSDAVERITGRPATTLDAFIASELRRFLASAPPRAP